MTYITAAALTVALHVTSGVRLGVAPNTALTSCNSAPHPDKMPCRKRRFRATIGATVSVGASIRNGLRLPPATVGPATNSPPSLDFNL